MEGLQKSQEREIILKYAYLAPEVWKKLDEVVRAGWEKRLVKNPESVQEHTISLLKLAASFPGLTVPEREDLLSILEVHDWPEVIHGDEIVPRNDEEKAKIIKATKFEKERQAMTEICSELGGAGEKIFSLWLRFENSDDKISSLAREIDKYQAMEKALEYEKAQGVPLFEEFLVGDLKKITNPVLSERLTKLHEEWVSGKQ